MSTIAVLGMGLLGRGFAENLLNKGHEVVVWNRTASRCAPLAQLGARVANSPADAVAGVDRVHLILTADAAVDSVMEALRPGLADGTIVVDHSTNLPAEVSRRAPRLAAQGVRYVHAPVFMGPRNSREGSGLMLICGAADEVDALRAPLLTMTGRLMELGEAPDKAAKMKLMGNGLLIMLTATMGDLFAMGEASGVDAEEILALFDAFTPTASGMGRRALAAPSKPVGFEMTMARKDVGLMIETAGGPDGLAVLPGVARAMDEAIADGRGADDFTTLALPGR